MKKTKVSGEKASDKTMDDYISTFPKEVQLTLEKIRKTVREAAPEAEEAIRYQMPTFRLHGNLVHFAAYKNHIGFYPTRGAIQAFKKELSEYELSKGTVQFAKDKPLPFDLISKMVKFRVAQNLEKDRIKKISKR